MKKNTYPGLVLASCLSIASTPLVAEVVSPAKHPASISAPATSITEHLEPSELQRQQAEHNKANITAPATSTTDQQLEPSELQRQQAEHNKANITKPATSTTDQQLEPSELQRQQAERNKARAK